MKLANAFPLIFFFILAVVLAVATKLHDKPNFVPSLVGKQLAEFEATDLNHENGKVSNADFANNDATIVNLFASWCVPCKAEHPFIKDLAKKGYQIYGVNVGDTRGDAEKYLKEHGNPYEKVAFDPRRQILINFGSTGVPETYVVDKTGKIYFHQRGVIDQKIIDEQLIPIIEGLKAKK